ncbi:MAG TPA: electron transport complex subunit RsxC [Clostridiales bacterium]|nr:electron transport complex subunit RsxC [Clostridiales bacterium]
MKRQLKSYFYGGIHPSDGTDKLLSNQTPIKYYVPKRIEISMMQSIGHVSKCIVDIGDRVTLGQLIGIPQEFGTANIHASVPGIILDIIKVDDEHDGVYDVVVIETDNNFDINELYHNKDYSKQLKDISSYSRETLISSMKDGGIIGMGGAGFPTHIKYETNKTIDTVLINAAECEPYLTCDHRIMLEFPFEIINGVNLMIKAANANKATICLEDNKADAAKKLQEILENSNLPIKVKLLATRYPQGGERQLIQAVIKKEIPIGKLPAELGVIVSNVATAKALADMTFNETPLITRCITITGFVNKPSNYMVPIGTLLNDLISESGGISIDGDNKIIHGGPMTGTCIASNSNGNGLIGGVLKISSGIVVLGDEEIIESPCIRCGRCERVCPAGLAPFKIDFAAIENDLSLCDKLYATECISCGACSYVCPARRELAWRITIAKNEIFNQRHKNGGK